MRLLMVGKLGGQMTAATKIAMDNGAKVVHAETIAQAMRSLRNGAGCDLIMIDVYLDISDLAKQLNNERINAPIVACGTSPDAEAAILAIQAGAQEYIPLPPDPKLIAAVLHAVTNDVSKVIVEDESMKSIYQFASQIAPSDASVLITGESGTGKEVIAKYVHRSSKRANKPFISVNCAAIPENLLESELFGHEKGAFTGAIARRVGKFEEANGGTLLLDEISEMDIRLQAKLLRAIQERVIDRVGGTSPVPVDIRILATSNRNLDEAVKEGIFREDLLFRLNVVNLHLPPLRQRPNDISRLAEHFAHHYCNLNGIPPRGFSKESMQALIAYQWRGNVRELENTIHRAVLLAQSEIIEPENLTLPNGQASIPSHPNIANKVAQTAEAVTRKFVGQTVAEVEKNLIIDTLSHCLGNRTHAANILGISIRTLRNKLKQYQEEGVEVPSNGDGHAA